MLEGTLDGFTLPDIFQLLAFTRKSGCLTVDGDTGTGRVYFREGQVYFSAASTGSLALGKRLIGAGLLSVEQLEAALDAQRSGRGDGKGLRLGRILVEQGAIDDETLTTFVQEQIQDAVFDLMRWNDGQFHFQSDGDDATVDEDIQLSVSVENLVMEGSRRLDEWDSVQRKIPSMDAVVTMAAVPDSHGVEVSLKPEEWRLLTLVDGRRTIAELVDLYGQGEFQTAKVLYGMVSTGLLEVQGADGEREPGVSSLLRQRAILAALEADLAATPDEVDDEPVDAPGDTAPNDAVADDPAVDEAVADEVVADEVDEAVEADEADEVDEADEDHTIGSRSALQAAAEELASTGSFVDDAADGSEDVEDEAEVFSFTVPDETMDLFDEQPAEPAADGWGTDEDDEPGGAWADDPSDEVAEGESSSVEDTSAEVIEDDRLFAAETSQEPVLTTDPDLDSDLVQRLLDGVRGL